MINHNHPQFPQTIARIKNFPARISQSPNVSSINTRCWK